METKIRIAAIIIKNKRLLLVKGKFREFWTPGGKREEGESDADALARELLEELNVKMESAEFFKEYKSKSPYEDVIIRSRVYIASISGQLKAGNEINSYVWVTKQEFLDGKYPLIKITEKEIIPDVIKAGFY